MSAPRGTGPGGNKSKRDVAGVDVPISAKQGSLPAKKRLRVTPTDASRHSPTPSAPSPCTSVDSGATAVVPGRSSMSSPEDIHRAAANVLTNLVAPAAEALSILRRQAESLQMSNAPAGATVPASPATTASASVSRPPTSSAELVVSARSTSSPHGFETSTSASASISSRSSGAGIATTRTLHADATTMRSAGPVDRSMSATTSSFRVDSSSITVSASAVGDGRHSIGRLSFRSVDDSALTSQPWYPTGYETKAELVRKKDSYMYALRDENPASLQLMTPTLLDTVMTTEELREVKRRRRQQKNRISAQASRQRRRMAMEQLREEQQAASQHVHELQQRLAYTDHENSLFRRYWKETGTQMPLDLSDAVARTDESRSSAQPQQAQQSNDRKSLVRAHPHPQQQHQSPTTNDSLGAVPESSKWHAQTPAQIPDGDETDVEGE